MKTILPADFDTTMAICPPFTDGVGDPEAAETGGGEPFIVPEKAKNKQHGMEFLRFLMSKAEAKYFAENVLSISAVIGGAGRRQGDELHEVAGRDGHGR